MLLSGLVCKYLCSCFRFFWAALYVHRMALVYIFITAASTAPVVWVSLSKHVWPVLRQDSVCITSWNPKNPSPCRRQV